MFGDFGEFKNALFFSWTAVGFSCVIGYIILIIFRAKKIRRKKEEQKRQALLKELGIDESPASLAELQDKYRKD